MVKSPFWKTTLAFCFGLTGIGAQAEPTVLPGAQPLQTIAALDVPRYMGTWYEIAKFPNWFQKKCIGATRAEYRQLQDGSVQVINRCRLDNGEMSEVIGKARQVGLATSPKLKVRFAADWLSGSSQKNGQ